MEELLALGSRKPTETPVLTALTRARHTKTVPASPPPVLLLISAVVGPHTHTPLASASGVCPLWFPTSFVCGTVESETGTSKEFLKPKLG